MKKTHYFKKDKKATVYKKKSVVEKAGLMPRDKYIATSLYPIWCYTSQLSQSRIYQAMGVGSDENRFFVFNHLKDVAVDDAILYRGKWYHITRVDTEDDYNTDTFIYVDDMSTPPEADEILDYEAGSKYL